MANKDHLEILKQGVEAWNLWLENNPQIQPSLNLANLSGADLIEASLYGADLSGANLRGADLSMADLGGAKLIEADLSGAILGGTNLSRASLHGADLSEANLFGANLREADLGGAKLRKANLGWADLSGAILSRANLSEANLSRANLSEANLSGANLSRAYLREADLGEADLRGTDLRGADLSEANLFGANLSRAYLREANLSRAYLREADLSGANLSRAKLIEANLSGANLSEANLIRANLEKANISGCRVYGISAWDLALAETIQKDLVITLPGESSITVDDIEVAQFIYLMLNNEKIRRVIDTITSKAILILGRFTEERKVVLDAMKDELRERGYLPILFDFKGPESKTLKETILTLAGMSRFIIADVTDPKSIPAELQAIVPNLPSVPIRLLIQKGAREFALIEHIKRYPWVLETYQYDDTLQLLASLSEQVIEPAERKVIELREK